MNHDKIRELLTSGNLAELELAREMMSRLGVEENEEIVYGADFHGPVLMQVSTRNPGDYYTTIYANKKNFTMAYLYGIPTCDYDWRIPSKLTYGQSFMEKETFNRLISVASAGVNFSMMHHPMFEGKINILHVALTVPNELFIILNHG
jgi:hypothetical protein